MKTANDILQGIPAPVLRFRSFSEAVLHLACCAPAHANKGQAFRVAARILFQQYRAPRRLPARGKLLFAS